MFRRRKAAGSEAEASDEAVDVAARLHPYEELFNEAMQMAARFTADRERRGRTAPVVPANVHVLRRRAS